MMLRRRMAEVASSSLVVPAILQTQLDEFGVPA
jgi:hypothetical protein